MPRRIQACALFALMGLTVLPISGCAARRQREQVRSGMFALGIAKAAFLDTWGRPTRTRTETGESAAQADWGRFGGSFSMGKGTFPDAATAVSYLAGNPCAPGVYRGMPTASAVRDRPNERHALTKR